MHSEGNRNQTRNRRRLMRYPAFACALLLTTHIPLQAEPTSQPDEARPLCERLRSQLNEATTPEARRTAAVQLAQYLLTHGCAAGLTAELRIQIEAGCIVVDAIAGPEFADCTFLRRRHPPGTFYEAANRSHCCSRISHAYLPSM